MPSSKGYQVAALETIHFLFCLLHYFWETGSHRAQICLYLTMHPLIIQVLILQSCATTWVC